MLTLASHSVDNVSSILNIFNKTIYFTDCILGLQSNEEQWPVKVHWQINIDVLHP